MAPAFISASDSGNVAMRTCYAFGTLPLFLATTLLFAQDKPPQGPVAQQPTGVLVQGKDSVVKGTIDTPDPKLVKDRLIVVGEFAARIVEVGEGVGSLKLQVPLQVAVPNQEAIDRLAGLQGELVDALRIEDPIER